MYRLSRVRQTVPYEEFDRLLPTWPLRFTQRKTQLGEADHLEERFGDGHFEDRKKLLHVTVVLLGRTLSKAKINEVFHLLVAARDAAALTSLARAKMLRDRDELWKAERQNRAAAIKKIKALLTHREKHEFVPSTTSRLLRQTLNALGPTPPVDKLKQGINPVADLDKLRSGLKTLRIPSKIRGFRYALKEAGCAAKPRNVGDALLMSVGLIPYREQQPVPPTQKIS